MVRLLVSALAAPVLTSAKNASHLPRGVNLDMTEEESARAVALVEQFAKEYEEGNVAISDIANTMQNCDQMCSNWCWATGATMVATNFGWSEGCAAGEKKSATRETKIDCSSCVAESSTAHTCECGSDTIEYYCDSGGGPDQMVDAIAFLSGAKYKSVANALSQSALSTALSHGPVIICVFWNYNPGGHAITIRGISNGKYIGHDPEGLAITTDYLGLLKYVLQVRRIRQKTTIYSAATGFTDKAATNEPDSALVCTLVCRWRMSKGATATVLVAMRTSAMLALIVGGSMFLMKASTVRAHIQTQL